MRGAVGSSQAPAVVEKTIEAQAMSEDDVYVNVDTFLNPIWESMDDAQEEVPLKRKLKRKLHEESAQEHHNWPVKESKKREKTLKEKKRWERAHNKPKIK